MKCEASQGEVWVVSQHLIVGHLRQVNLLQKNKTKYATIKTDFCKEKARSQFFDI